MRRLRREPNMDLIHAHWLIPQGLAAIVARTLANRRVLILCTSHGGDLFGLRGPLLTLKLGPLPEPVRTRIEPADADTLLRWSGRVLSADQLDEVFGA